MTTAGVPALRVRTAGVRILGWSLFLLWAAAAVAVGLARPGAVLELALGGVGGAAAWLISRGHTSSLADIALAAACFAIPLLNTLPLRIYDSAWSSAPRPIWAVLSVESLLVLAAIARRLGRLRHLRFPPVVTAAAVVFLLAGATSSAVASDKSSAAAYAWVTFAVPIMLAVLIAAETSDAAAGWRWMGTAMAAAIVPAYIGISAYLLDFGLPGSSADLVLTKVALFRPHLFQDATFGNVQHLADFALVLLPAALVATTAAIPRPARAIGGALSMACVALLILVLSRAALIVGAVAALVLLAALVSRAPRRRAAAPAVALVILVAVMLTPTVRRSFSGLLPQAAPTPASVKLGPAGGVIHPGRAGENVESSEAFRLKAISASWRIFRRHAPLGVGTGEYARYDPVSTAAHSLPLQLLAENGVLGLVGFVLLYAYLIWAAVLTVIRRRATPAAEYGLRLACGGGALALLTHGLIAGVALSLGSAAVWALLLWLQVGVLAGLDRAREVGSAA